MLRNQLRPAIVMTLALCLVTGFIYPGVVTGIAQLVFPRQANGSLITVNGRVVGSELIGQPFSRPEYFHPRPSGAGSGYDGAASAGTNKGPTDRKLADTLIAGRIDSLVAAGVVTRGEVPSDMVTASASGLDPHISPANARLQAPRVATARGVGADAVQALVDRHTEGRQFGFFGEPRVNVLLLNIALDSTHPTTTPLVARVQGCEDEDEVVIGTGPGLPGFVATGGSLGLDVAPHTRFLWRTEVRTFQGSDPIFPDRSEPTGVAKSNTVAVSSFAVSF